MPIQCLTAGRFTMQATLLHQNENYAPLPGGIDMDQFGDFVESQDALTGEIVRIWKPYDNPLTPSVNEDTLNIGTIPCLARGIVDGGIRVAGTTERFGDAYENIDYVKMWVPASTRISKRDRVTNIGDGRGHIYWKDEEYADPTDPADIAKATVFNVNGVTPLFNAFNRHTESFVLLQRATVSGEVE